MLSFFVHGTPMPEPRPRARVIAGHAGIYHDKRADGWKQAVRDAAIAAIAKDGNPHEGPIYPAGSMVVVWMSFAFQRPKSHKLKSGELSAAGRRMPWMTSKPDLDNLAKAVLDALGGWPKGNPPLVWKDDAQVTDIRCSKEYGDGEPGVHVTILGYAQGHPCED